MKYCVKFKKDFKYLSQVDELLIRFREQDTSLLDFLLLYKNKRINIYIEDVKEFIDHKCLNIFNTIITEHPELDFAFVLSYYEIEQAKNLLKLFDESGITHKYFFNMVVNDWDTLTGLIDLKVSEMYIGDELGFDLLRVGRILHSKNIRVRVYPNVAQSKWPYTQPLKTFFIRPEDVQEYEGCVDVMEFFGTQPESTETYFKIYVIDKKWFGKLSEVIRIFNDDKIDSRYLLPHFARCRIKCAKRCMKGRPCKICDVFEELAESLEVHNLEIKKEN